ncbi:MAG: redoxin domain-containing protein [Thaumarchaeota archaeon]|nr:MAG: redoxin domain-containing protein [Nitrososphaerota archaeon]
MTKINVYVVVFGIIGIVIVAAALSALVSNQGSVPTDLSKVPNRGPAPNFQGIAAWINSPVLNLSELRGKVVLVDFWTYSCINCIRTLPYLNAWYGRYGNNGLVIVGVHTPEFQFEKNYSNVLAAVKSLEIKYPVALDSGYATWNAYGNQYWPADYLIDKNGDIRDMHIGEGGYNATEMLIQALLQNAGYTIRAGITANSVNGTNVKFSQVGTPEIYVGYSTARLPIGNPQGFSPGQVVSYTLSGPMQNNTVYFSGKWYNAPDSVISAGSDSKLFLIYKAKNANVVAQGNSSLIIVKLDGKNLSQTYLGSDLVLRDGAASASISSARLYNIVGAPSYGWHVLEIIASPGFRLYTFTFG